MSQEIDETDPFQRWAKGFRRTPETDNRDAVADAIARGEIRLIGKGRQVVGTPHLRQRALTLRLASDTIPK